MIMIMLAMLARGYVPIMGAGTGQVGLQSPVCAGGESGRWVVYPVTLVTLISSLITREGRLEGVW